MHNIIILIATYFLSFGQASAAFVYTYTGNQMQSAPSQLNPDPSSLPPGLSSLQFTMVGDLGVDRAYSRFFPSGWAINDGVHAFTSSAPPPNLNLYLEFATNGAGAITDWYIQVPTWDPLTNISLLLRTTNTVTDDQAPGAPPQVFDESSACGSPCTGFGTAITAAFLGTTQGLG